MVNGSISHEFSYFPDGTATKSPRKIPVLLNSEKLANRGLNYGKNDIILKHLVAIVTNHATVLSIGLDMCSTLFSFDRWEVESSKNDHGRGHKFSQQFVLSKPFETL